MGYKENIKAIIAENVYTNHRNLVTAENVKAAEYAIVDGLGAQIDALQGKFYGYFPTAADLPAGDARGYAFVGASSPYSIYNFDGTTWTNSGSSYAPPVGNGEDINTDSNGLLQFADRAAVDGMGYVILRQNKTFADQVTAANTIYEIRYDFALDADFTMPANCVLKFNGGTISGAYILTGQNTKIDAADVQIFGLDILLQNFHEINVCWFGAKGDDTFDNTEVFNKALKITKSSIHIPAGVYKITGTIDASELDTSWYGDEGSRTVSTWEPYVGSVIHCAGDNSGNPFLQFPRGHHKNLVILGDSVQDDPSEAPRYAYDNSIGVQLGKPGYFLYTSIFENINIYYFGTGLQLNCLAGSKLQDFKITRNRVAVECRADEESGVDSGYATIVSFVNPSIDHNYERGILFSRSNSTHAQGYPLDIIGGYIEQNDKGAFLGNSQIYVERQCVVNFINFYTESEKLIDFDNSINTLSEIGFVNFHSPFVKKIVVYGKTWMYNCRLYYGELEQHLGGYNIIASELHKLTPSADIAATQWRSIVNSRIYNYAAAQDISVMPLNNVTSFGTFPAFATIMLAYKMMSVSYANRLAIVDTNGNVLDAQGRKINELAGPDTGRPTGLANNARDGGYLYFDLTTKKPEWWDGQYWREADGAIAGVNRSGTFSQKPAGGLIYVGFAYFCTDKQTAEGATNGIMIYYKGSNTWVDALGRTIS